MVSDFTLFPELPPELRLIIMAAATNHIYPENTKIIEVSLWNAWIDGGDWIRRRGISQPGVYQVNPEFYEEARLQQTPLLFRLVNLYTDILHICSYLEFTHVDLLRLLPRDTLLQFVILLM
jgi:hypothetical protein